MSRILTDPHIISQFIKPFKREKMGQVTYDLSLANVFGKLRTWDNFVRADDKSSYCFEELIYDSLFLNAGDFVLALTSEELELPSNVVGFLSGRSTLARLGITIHVTAGLIHPGFKGQIVLEIANLSRVGVVLPAGMSIAQIYFMELDESVPPYQGVYNNQFNFTPSCEQRRLEAWRKYDQ